MKLKKLLYGITGIAMVVCMGFSLTACNSNETPTPEDGKPPIVDGGTPDDGTNPDDGDGLIFSLELEFNLNPDKESYSVTGIGLCEDTEIVIPSVYKDLPVTSIRRRAFYGCRSFASILIPDSVTLIEESVFEGCSSLTSVTIGKGVTSIGACAFTDCSSLTSITIPDSVTRIGWGVFKGCSSLISVTIGKGVVSIGHESLMGCSSLTSITIPDSVTSIV